MIPRLLRLLLFALVLALRLSGQSLPSIITFNDDGGWCWFEDPRAIVYEGRLIIGSVAAGARDPARRGNIEVMAYDLATGRKHLAVLHQNLSEGPGKRYDDHDSPALLVRPDGRILAVYSKHGLENRFYYRISVDPDDPDRWQAERTFVPSVTSRITYSNLHWLSLENGGKGRIDGKRHYEIFKGTTANGGASWSWMSITADSSQDNLRPISPSGRATTWPFSGCAAPTVHIPNMPLGLLESSRSGGEAPMKDTTSRRDFLGSTTRRCMAWGLYPGAAWPKPLDRGPTSERSLDREKIEAEIRCRAEQQVAQRRLVVDYYRIRRRLAYPLPVKSLWIPTVPVPTIPAYPWSIWMLWQLEERVNALGWAAEWFRQEKFARQAARPRCVEHLAEVLSTGPATSPRHTPPGSSGPPGRSGIG
jgi:hypothetical protein